MPVAKSTKTTKAGKAQAPQEKENPISSKLGSILDNIGSQYGESLQKELLDRLEKTIAEFDEEVMEMIGELQQRSLQRREKLHQLWEQRNLEPEPESEPGTEAETEGEEVSAGEEPERDMSEWERRLEMLDKKS